MGTSFCRSMRFAALNSRSFKGLNEVLDWIGGNSCHWRRIAMTGSRREGNCHDCLFLHEEGGGSAPGAEPPWAECLSPFITREYRHLIPSWMARGHYIIRDDWLARALIAAQHMVEHPPEWMTELSFYRETVRVLKDLPRIDKGDLKAFWALR